MARRSSYRSSPNRRPQWLVIATGIASLVNALIRLFKLFGSKKSGSTTSPKSTSPASRSPAKASPRVVKPAPEAGPVGSDGGIPDLYRQQRSDVVVTASGLVVKVLPDDQDTSDGSEMHQKFLVELIDKNRTTVRVCHNLKFGRAPIKEGQVVGFKGEYEYNELGGTIHWTHHDPRGTHEDGWIEIDGQRYG
jgi:Protein of unknown function (DUF3465)